MFGGFYFGEMYFGEGALLIGGGGPPPPPLVYVFSNVVGPVTSGVVPSTAEFVGSIPI